MFGHFYNESLRKLTIAFGSLFDEIYVTKKNSDGSENSKIQVPIQYASKEKFLRRLEEQSGISDNTKIQISLPRLSFELGSINYDPTRHLNKINTRVKRTDGSDPMFSFQEVPYNVSFSLFCYTRNMDENLQIIEQILPYFSPEFTVTLNLNGIEKTLDVPIVLTDVAMQEQYEGNFLDRRIIASTFNFVCKTRVYGEIKSQTPIVSSTISLVNEFPSGATQDIFNEGATGSTTDYGE